MKEAFVLIFREGTRKLSEEEQKSRTEAVRDWALQQVRPHNLDPRVLSDESRRLGDDFEENSHSRRVIALNFLEAEDFNHAIRIAQTHPGVQYGIGIEVRPWRDPRGARA